MTIEDQAQNRLTPKNTDVLSVREMTPHDARQTIGGRCWDGPLGDRDECPPKPSYRWRAAELGLLF